jgi:hypothetical protein
VAALLGALVCAVLLVILLTINNSAPIQMIAALLTVGIAFLGWRASRAFLRAPTQSVPPERVIGVAFGVAVMTVALVIAAAMLVRVISGLI